MQIMIDVAVETPEALDIATEFLKQHAALKRAMNVPTGTAVAAPEMIAGVDSSRPIGKSPLLAADFTPTETVKEALQNFGAPFAIPVPSNVVPFPPAPPAPEMMATTTGVNSTAPIAPVVPTAAPLSAPTTNVVPFPPAPPAPVPPSANSAGSVTGATAPVELDTAGMPWDTRIHSKNKSRKQDGTWRIARGVEPSLIAAVTQELHARMINSIPPPPANLSVPSANTPAPEVPSSMPSFPSSMPLPPVPPVALSGSQLPQQTSERNSAIGSVPVPPVPANGSLPDTFGKFPLPPGVLPGSATPAVNLPPAPPVPVSAPPVLGMPHATDSGVVPSAPAQADDYRQFVMEANKLRNNGRLTAEQITAIVQQAGAPSVQLLGNMPHLVPRANWILNATLAGWLPQQIAEYLRLNNL